MDPLRLRTALEKYASADSVEEEHRQRMLRLLQSEGDPFSRAHFFPGHFTASAFVLSSDEQSLLLIHHAKLGLWLQPGGHIDSDDEDIYAAARRELEEETGLSDCTRDSLIPDLLDVDIHKIPPNPKKDEPGHEHFDVRILFCSRSDHIVAGSDALDARWVPLDAIESIATDESVMRAVRKLRSRAR